MAVQAGDKIQRSTLVTLYNNMIEEAFANRLGVGSIGSHFASAWMVNAHKPLAKEINRLYAVFAAVNTGKGGGVSAGDLMRASTVNAAEQTLAGIRDGSIACSASCTGLCSTACSA